MIICHIVAPARFGGLEAVVSALSEGMARRGHRVRILSLVEPGADSAFPLSPAGVEIVAIEVPARRYDKEIAALGRELSRSKGIIAHSHGYRANLTGIRAARRAKVPILSTVHGYTGGDWKNRAYEWMDRRALRRFDAVVAVSPPLLTSLRASGIPEDRLHLLVNATGKVDLRPRSESRRLLGLPAGGLVAGWIGRVSPEKGPDVFAEALDLAPSWTGSVIGEGPMRASLAQRRGPAARLHWHGALPEAASYLAAFDAVVLSSRTEGTPIVLLEAFAAGIPVVATAVGGIPAVVTSGEALLVESEDPAAIATALEQVATDPAGAAKRVEAAKTLLTTRFSLPGWLDGYERIYRGLGGAAS